MQTSDVLSYDDGLSPDLPTRIQDIAKARYQDQDFPSPKRVVSDMSFKANSDDQVAIDSPIDMSRETLKEFKKGLYIFKKLDETIEKANSKDKSDTMSFINSIETTRNKRNRSNVANILNAKLNQSTSQM